MKRTDNNDDNNDNNNSSNESHKNNNRFESECPFAALYRNTRICQICTESMNESNFLYSSACSHVFCTKCVQRAINELGRAYECMICRTPCHRFVQLTRHGSNYRMAIRSIGRRALSSPFKNNRANNRAVAADPEFFNFRGDEDDANDNGDDGNEDDNDDDDNNDDGNDGGDDDDDDDDDVNDTFAATTTITRDENPTIPNYNYISFDDAILSIANENDDIASLIADDELTEIDEHGYTQCQSVGDSVQWDANV